VCVIVAGGRFKDDEGEIQALNQLHVKKKRVKKKRMTRTGGGSDEGHRKKTWG